jgi:F-type H+-transporting ATPase subunit delta
MTNRSAAIRYARALFDVVLSEEGDLSIVEVELAGFSDLLTTHEVLGKVLLNPAVPAPKKRDAVAQLAERAGVAPVLGKLLVLLAERDRLVVLPDLLEAYRSRLRDHQNVVRAEITSAEPLAPQRVQTIDRSLQKVTGRSVSMTSNVDPALIGGLVAHVGGTVYDGSVATQLVKMRKKLAESV